MQKKYRIRHAILGTLQAKLSKFDLGAEVNEEEVRLTIDELAGVLRRPQKEVMNQVDYLLLQKEVHINRIAGGLTVFILAPGSAAYFDSKYPQEGQKVFWNNLFDVAKTISTIVLLIFAVITNITGILRSQRTEEDIRQLKKEVRALKRSQMSKPLIKSKPVPVPIIKKSS